MRAVLPERLESGRVVHGQFASDPAWGAYGKFVVQGPCGESLTIVASAADLPESHGWEHVSISTRRRAPNWTEMCFVKDLFWSEDECVIQFHPPRSEYVNNHPYCLHLWRPSDGHVRLPPSILVGFKDKGLLNADEAERLWREQQTKVDNFPTLA
jgi:hypothetical protein